MSHCTCVKSVIVSFCHLGLNHENIPRQFYCHNTSNNLIYSQPRPYSYIQQQFACNIMLGIPNKPANGVYRGAKITLDFIYFSFHKTIQASYQKLIVAYHWQLTNNFLAPFYKPVLPALSDQVSHLNICPIYLIKTQHHWERLNRAFIQTLIKINDRIQNQNEILIQSYWKNERK